MIKIPLKEITEIKFGYYGKSVSKGKYNYIQAKYFDNFGTIINPMDSFINITSNNEDHVLQNGDILFISKGFRYFSWCYHSDYGPAIASAIFFVIRPDKAVVIPEYLVTYFNLPRNQEFFKQFGAGSSIPSIRKSELGYIPIPILPIKDQEKIVILSSLHRKEIELSNAIIKNKMDLFQSVVTTLIK